MKRAVIVGAGGISDAWFPPLMQEKVEIAAVVDLKVGAAAAKIQKYGLTSEASSDLAAALSRARPDFVLDLTVPEAHCQVTCTALRAGCPVIGEKPMASSMAEARRMVQASEETGKLFMVSQSRRWDVRHDRVRRTLAAGTLGEVTIASCDFFLGAHFGGFRDQMESPLILDMAIHHFDLARFLTGRDAVAVYAKEFNPRGSWYAGDSSACCIFELAGGAIFSYRGSWSAEGFPTSWNGDWRIVGERGTLLYDRDKDPVVQVPTSTEGFQRPLGDGPVAASPLTAQTMHGALREMLAYLDGGPKPQTECHDNIRSLAMVFAAKESAASGTRVAVAAG